MLSCREITELATAYAERALPFMDRVRFLMHLSMCTHCRRYVKQLRLAVDVSGRVSLPTPKPTPETKEALLRTFRGWQGGRGRPPTP
jgi:hypothetical protein